MGLLGLFSTLIIATCAIRVRRSLMSLCCLGFILCAAATALRYIDGYNAAERLGYWAMLAILYFWAASAEESCLHRTAVGLAIAGAVAAAYGLCQFLYPALDGILCRDIIYRLRQAFSQGHRHAYGGAVSSFGNVNFAASYMAAALPLILGWRPHRRGATVVKWLAAAIVTWYLLKTGSRAAWIGAAAGMSVFILAGGFAGVRRKSKVLILLGAGAILAIPAAVSSWRGEILTRIGSLADLERGSTRVRIEVWAGTCDMIGENFWLGVGTGQFAHHFHRYRYPEEYLISEGRLVDDPHQLALLLFAECGVTAALFSALFAMATAVRLVSLVRRREPMAAMWFSSWVSVMVVGLFSSSLLFPATAVFFSLASGFADRHTPVLPWQKAWKWFWVMAAGALVCLWAIIPFHLLAEVSYTRGLKAFYRRDFTAAEAFFAGAVRRFPDGIYEVEWGRALLACGNYAQAASALEAAIARMPSLKEGYIDLGICRANLREESPAVAIWAKACSLFPACADAHYNLGQLVAGSDPKRARHHLFMSSALGRPTDFNYWALLAECYRKMGNYPQALITWTVAKDLDPEHPLPYLKIELLSAHLPSGEDWYLRFFRAGPLREPQHVKDCLAWGIFYETTGSLGQAWASYNRAVEIEPGSTLPRLHIALIMGKTGLVDAALTTLEEVRNSGSDSQRGLALFYMGRIYEERGSYPLACIMLQESTHYHWVRPMAHLHLAQIALQLGEEEIARQHLREAKTSGFVDWELLVLPRLTQSTIYREYLKSDRHFVPQK